MMFSLSLMGASVFLLLNGMFVEALVVFVLDVIISWIGGYRMMQKDKNR